MTDNSIELNALRTENIRLNKIVRALMERAERSSGLQNSDFGLFQATIMLEDQVSIRTAELQAALNENVKINGALRESEERFRTLANQSMVGIVIMEDWKFTYTNGKFNTIFGYSADEVSALDPIDIFAESESPLVLNSMRKQLSGELREVNRTFRGLRKDGRTIDVEVNSSTIWIGNSLALIGLVMGSIYGGVATPTEAGAIGVISALVIAASYRSLNVRILKTALHRTLVMSGNILFIVFVSMIAA